jgi:predicted amidophosphoribosyltransferase
MLNEQTNSQCPVCGYPDLDEPPFDEGGHPTYNICPCCGTEFGYDDASRAHAQLRDDWIKNGMVWWSSYVEPRSRWNPLAQLKNAGFK